MKTRGQATVELALGLLVFITVLIAAIHFGELSFLSLKVHEAAASASWDATAYRVERPGPSAIDRAAWYDSSKIASPAAQTKGLARYDDYDGRAAVNRGKGPVQVFTDAQPLVGKCDVDRASPVAFRIETTAVTPGFLDPGVVKCQATGTLNTIRVPVAYFDANDNGWFKSAHLRTAPMTVCSTGRAVSGQCTAGIPMMLGDHALTSGGGEESECAVEKDDPGATGGACKNSRFYALAHENWDRSQPYSPLPEDWAEDVTGSRPNGKVTGFYMSFRGEESGFGETINRFWDTTPMDYGLGGAYRAAYTANQNRDSGDLMKFLYAGRYRCD